MIETALKTKVILPLIVALFLLGGVLLLPTLMFASTEDDTPQATGVNLGISAAVPAEYADIVQRAGTLCEGITPAVIAAQIDVESGWNPTATSTVGAAGIAQFMPDTWTAHGLDGDGDGKADITNAIDSIWSQGNYDCQLYAAVSALTESGLIRGDRLDLTLAAYNAGLGNVQQYSGAPPFAETENYIARIRERIATYSGDTIGQVASRGDVADALEWAKSIAADDSHQYVLGGEGPHYDCSGLTQAFMKRLGILLPHRADEQARLGTLVTAAQAQPGDLIFWSDDGGAYYYHAAIYLGGGMMVSADNPNDGINVEKVYWPAQTMYRTYH